MQMVLMLMPDFLLINADDTAFNEKIIANKMQTIWLFLKIETGVDDIAVYTWFILIKRKRYFSWTYLHFLLYICLSQENEFFSNN